MSEYKHACRLLKYGDPVNKKQSDKAGHMCLVVLVTFGHSRHVIDRVRRFCYTFSTRTQLIGITRLNHNPTLNTL